MTWVPGDLTPQELPINILTPVQFFLKLFGTDTIQLITEHTNVYRAAEEIARNKPILPILQSEIRQVLGILIILDLNQYSCQNQRLIL